MTPFLDRIICFFSVFLIFPFLCLIFLVLYFLQGRPVFFCQSRIGKDFVAFKLYKFRTMELIEGSEKGSFDAGDETRITTIGAALRQTKLDELPQLINVLKGDMSIVGPRPEVARWVYSCREDWSEILKVRPGITDPASIIYRKEAEILSGQNDPEKYYKDVILPDKISMYKQYVKNKSLILDIKVICLTIKKIITS